MRPVAESTQFPFRYTHIESLEKELACPKCGYHFRIDVQERVGLLLDEGSEVELFGGVRPSDPLKFKDSKTYKARLKDYQKRTGAPDAVMILEGTMEETPVVLAAMDYRFMGGSMGSVVGEKITRAAERALETGVGVEARAFVPDNGESDLLARIDAVCEGVDSARFHSELRDAQGGSVPVDCSLTRFATRSRVNAFR